MESQEVVNALVALGQLNRLAVFRLIVEHGSGGIRPLEISEALDIPSATLSFHLKELYQLRSKSCDEFAHPDAPKIDIVITVCDSAASEVCPVWVGMPVVGHWGFNDPSRVFGDDNLKRAAFLEVMGGLKARIERLAKMPLEDLECAELRNAIGELERL